MQIEERIRKLFGATPEQLAGVDAALDGAAAPRPSFKLYRISDAARMTGLSRVTVWRAIQEGRLNAVEIREGSRRIPEAELARFCEGRK